MEKIKKWYENQKDKKAFSLVELLAVIAIIAILAVIATPIITKVISNTKEQATLRSAELYESAVLTAVTKDKIHGIETTNDTYTVNDKGNIFKGETEIIVESKGDKPKEGSILTISNDLSKKDIEVTEATLCFGDLIAIKEDGEKVYKISKATKKNEYTVSATGVNVNINGSSSYNGVIKEDASLEFTLEVDENYKLPESITVNNAKTVYTRTSDTIATLKISEVKDNIILNITGISTYNPVYKPLYYTWNSGSVGNNFTGSKTTDPSIFNHPFYIGLDLDGTKVTAAYACFVRNNKEYCLKGEKSYTTSQPIMKEAFKDVTCNYVGTAFLCGNSEDILVRVFTDNDTHIVNGSSNCRVDEDGYFSCKE